MEIKTTVHFVFKHRGRLQLPHTQVSLGTNGRGQNTIPISPTLTYKFNLEEKTGEVPVYAMFGDVTRLAPYVIVPDEVPNRVFACFPSCLAARNESGGLVKLSTSVFFSNPHQFQTSLCTMSIPSNFVAKGAIILLRPT